MDHRQLAHLLAAVETGQIQRAAERVGLTPQAISKSIARLEAALGGELLKRTAKGVAPTALAERLLPHARLIVAEVGMVQRISDSARARGAGRLVVGISPVSANSWIMDVLIRFIARYPRLHVDIVSGLDMDFSEELLAGRMDLAFAIDLNRSTGEQGIIHTTDCGVEPWVLVGRSGHVLLRPDVTLPDLSGCGWIQGRNATMLDTLVADDFFKAGLPLPRPSVSTTSLEAMRNLLASSDMLAILPASLVRRWDGVSSLDIAHGRWKVPLCMLRRGRMVGDPLINELAAQIHAAQP